VHDDRRAAGRILKLGLQEGARRHPAHNAGNEPVCGRRDVVVEDEAAAGELDIGLTRIILLARQEHRRHEHDNRDDCGRRVPPGPGSGRHRRLRMVVIFRPVNLRYRHRRKK
jgi:hypothetical protein